MWHLAPVCFRGQVELFIISNCGNLLFAKSTNKMYIELKMQKMR